MPDVVHRGGTETFRTPTDTNEVILYFVSADEWKMASELYWGGNDRSISRGTRDILLKKYDRFMRHRYQQKTA